MNIIYSFILNVSLKLIKRKKSIESIGLDDYNINIVEN